MNLFQLNIPTKVYYGRNIIQDVLKKERNLFKGNVLIVTTGRSLIRLGYLEKLKEEIVTITTAENITIFDNISANPRLAEVKEGIALGKGKNIDVVIGFGGGSAMDAAKAIAAGIGLDEDVDVCFYGGKEPGKETLPIIAIPTTAGTGSELSKAAIITDDIKKIKGGIRGEAVYPTLAIVDSVFTESVPRKITMETGFDVLAHAIESYVSKAASPYTEMLSEQAIRLVGKYLPRLAEDLYDVEARQHMSFASMIMGINLGNASTALPHRMQYPLGAHTDTSHGAGLAALFSAWVHYETIYSPEKMKRVVELLTGNETLDVEKSIEEFIKSLELPMTLRELNVKEEHLALMAAEVTGNVQNDPASQEEDVILKIYKEAF